jgi:hypothetical protein
MNDTDSDRKLLEAFVIDNPDLGRLETLLDQFNLFEALGAIRVEVRHSDFLSFLLNPSQNHGLGDIVVKRLLQRSLSRSSTPNLPITPIDLDTWDLDELIVLREWQNIDILLIDEQNHLAVIIENKIDSGEHSEQLQRYWQIVNQHYPNWKVVGLFLTPDGSQPSDDNYFPIDYTTICEILEKLIETHKSTLGPDVLIAITHYSQMLRRHIVSGSEIEQLCRRIYRKHQQALDLIYEYRPDQQEAIRDIIEKLIDSNPQLVRDHCSKSYIRFGVKEWDVPILMEGEGWTRSKRILLFEFGNFPNRLGMKLIIGPGPLETRQKIFDLAVESKPFLKPAFNALGKMYSTIYSRDILSPSAYENNELDEIEVNINKKWKQFTESDLTKIHDILKSANWIWE